MSRLALALVLALAACAPSSVSSGAPPRAHGVVVAKVLQLGAIAPARVERVLAKPGARVERDQPLVQFDARSLATRRETADGEVARATAELARLERGARPDELKELRARCDELMARLSAASESEKPVLQAEFTGAEARFGLASKGARKEELDAARAVVQVAQARRRELDLEPVELRAPMAAIVDRIAVEDGATVSAHEVLVTLRDPARVFVEADLVPLVGSWQVNAGVWITSSLLPGQRFEGRVVEFGVPAFDAAREGETARPGFVRVRVEALDGRDLLVVGSVVEVEVVQ